MNRFILFTGLIIVVFLTSLSLAGIPKLINYQGMLTQSDGTTPVTNGNYNLTFKIYGSLAGTDSLWREYYPNVPVTNGLFSVILGSLTTLNLPFDTTYWLGIKVGTDPELTPRMQLTSVGYAFRAVVSDSAIKAISAGSGGGWIDDGTVVRLTTDTDKVGIGTTAPQVKLSLGTDITSKKLALWDGVDDFYGFGVELGRITVYTNNTEKMTVLTNGNVGIGTNSPEERLHVQDTTEGVIKVGTPTTNGNATIIFEEGNDDAMALRYDGMANELSIDDETQDTSRMVIERSGKVGIGTKSPEEKLHIWWGTNVDAELGRGVSDTDITYLALRNANGTKCYIYPNAAGNGIVVSTTKP
jgi:hypothetical protein